jgi:hypothetical protein
MMLGLENGNDPRAPSIANEVTTVLGDAIDQNRLTRWTSGL